MRSAHLSNALGLGRLALRFTMVEESMYRVIFYKICAGVIGESEPEQLLPPPRGTSLNREARERGATTTRAIKNDQTNSLR
jgi:hypothetical protein